MQYVVYYQFCGRYFTEVFSEAEFDRIFEGKMAMPSEGWVFV